MEKLAAARKIRTQPLPLDLVPERSWQSLAEGGDLGWVWGKQGTERQAKEGDGHTPVRGESWWETAAGGPWWREGRELQLAMSLELQVCLPRLPYEKCS